MTRGNFCDDGLNPGHIHHQISQPIGGIEPARTAGSLGHRSKPRRLSGKL